MKTSAEFLKWASQTGINNLVWCTDLDHTVLDTHLGANNVRANQGLEDNFHTLDLLTEGRFYVITGREMSFVDDNFQKLKLKASTEYHNMMRWENNGQESAVRAAPQWNLIESDLQDLLTDFWPANYAYKNKTFMRSIHYGEAPNLADPAIKAQVTLRLSDILNTYAMMTGDKLVNIDGGTVFDIAPAGSCKGAAIKDIMNHNIHKFCGRMLTPVYFGDSPGDIPAAHEVQKMGGKFIAVGDDPRVTALADFHVASPSLCRDLFINAAKLVPATPCYDISNTLHNGNNPSAPIEPEAPKGP